jgi:hypothetical protein
VKEQRFAIKLNELNFLISQKNIPIQFENFYLILKKYLNWNLQKNAA